MKQAALNLNRSVKKTRKQVFLAQMDQVEPWVAPFYPEGRTGKTPFFLLMMLSIHYQQQWFALSDSGMEDALFGMPLYREFAQLEEYGGLLDELTILRFRHRLEIHKLAEKILTTVNELLTERGLLLKVGPAADNTLIVAPTSTKNKDKTRDPEMHSSKKGNQWYFGTKVHNGVDAESGLVHTVSCTSGHISDIAEANTLLHGQESVAFGNAGYKCIENHPNAKAEVTWHVAMRPGKCKALNKENEACAMSDEAEMLKAGIRAKVDLPFQVVKRQFGYVKVRYRGLKMNTVQLFMLFAQSNLWMVRSKLMGAWA